MVTILLVDDERPVHAWLIDKPLPINILQRQHRGAPTGGAENIAGVARGQEALHDNQRLRRQRLLRMRCRHSRDTHGRRQQRHTQEHDA
jgi:hypothetical protein